MAGTPLAIRYLGHATLRIELDGVTFLTDPALRPRLGPLGRVAGPPPAGAADGVDAILISHLHHDHLDLASLAALPPATRIVVPSGAEAWLRDRGFADVVGLASGERTRIGSVSVEAVAARHGGRRPGGGPAAPALGYLLEGADSVWFAGDTGLHPAMADLAGRARVGLLPVWGWGPTLRRRDHLDPSDAARAAALGGLRIAVPIHWGTYWPTGFAWLRGGRLSAPPGELVRAAAELAPDIVVRPTSVGDEVDLR